MGKILEICQLSKRYRRFALNGIDFSVEAGKITGLIGINGAGKTTTIKSIAQLLNYDSGKIYFQGTELVHSAEQNERIGYVLDSSYFYENLTIKAMKDIIAAAYTTWDEAVFQSYCDNFKLDPKQKIESLSKGMKMKYSLALALSHNAHLLIMDEPTGGLDPLVRNSMMKILKKFVSNGKNSVLFSTHITSDLEKVADNIIFLHQGKVEYDGSLENMLREYRVIQCSESQHDALKDKIISAELDNHKYRGLMKTSDCKEIPKGVEVKNPVIEDIMLGIIASKDEEGEM